MLMLMTMLYILFTEIPRVGHQRVKIGVRSRIEVSILIHDHLSFLKHSNSCVVLHFMII